MGEAIINPNLNWLHSQTQGHRAGTHQSLLTLKGYGVYKGMGDGGPRIHEWGLYAGMEFGQLYHKQKVVYLEGNKSS